MKGRGGHRVCRGFAAGGVVRRVPRRVRVAGQRICGWFGLRVRRMCDLMARAVPEASARRCGIGRPDRERRPLLSRDGLPHHVRHVAAFPSVLPRQRGGRTPTPSAAWWGQAAQARRMWLAFPSRRSTVPVRTPNSSAMEWTSCPSLRMERISSTGARNSAANVHPHAWRDAPAGRSPPAGGPAGSPLACEDVSPSVQWVFDRTDMSTGADCTSVECSTVVR